MTFERMQQRNIGTRRSQFLMYNSINSELSSKGYAGIAAFYRYTRELKHRFCMFYRWKKFHTKETKVENFIKLTDNTAEIKKSKYQYPGQVHLEEKEITAGPKKTETFYIPPVESIPPDIRVFDLLAYFSGLRGVKGKARKESLTNIGIEELLKQRFWQLDKVDKLKVLLAAVSLVEPEIYLLYDLSRQMPGEGLVLIKDKLEELSKAALCAIF